MGAAGPSGDFEIRDDRRNDLGRGIMPVDPDMIGNTVDGGSSAAQLPQKNILERKEVLIGRSSSSLSVCPPAFLSNKPLVSHLLYQQITFPPLPPVFFPCFLLR